MTPRLQRLASLVFIWVVMHSIAGSAEPRLPAIQGVWFGDGAHPLSNYVLMIRDDELVVVSPLGGFVSSFDTGKADHGLNAIDIQRYDGKTQLGVFQVEESKLRLCLADPGAPRPTIKDVTLADGKPRWHAVFGRRPTDDGIAVLRRYLSSKSDPPSP